MLSAYQNQAITTTDSMKIVEEFGNDTRHFAVDVSKLSFRLDDVANANPQKLTDRKTRSSIQVTGCNR